MRDFNNMMIATGMKINVEDERNDNMPSIEFFVMESADEMVDGMDESDIKRKLMAKVIIRTDGTGRAGIALYDERGDKFAFLDSEDKDTRDELLSAAARVNEIWTGRPDTNLFQFVLSRMLETNKLLLKAKVISDTTGVPFRVAANVVLKSESALEGATYVKEDNGKVKYLHGSA